MNSFVLEVWDDESEKVTFYSVRWDNAEYSEMDRFLSRISNVQKMKRPLQELLQLITEVIGSTYGAQEAFFNRFENRVTALPPRGKVKVKTLQLDYKDFPLRLYCLVLSDEIVVLFNGGIKEKDARSVQESSDVITAKFYEANEFAKRILNAVASGEIYIEERSI